MVLSDYRGTQGEAAVCSRFFVGGSFFSAFFHLVPRASLHLSSCWDKGGQWNSKGVTIFMSYSCRRSGSCKVSIAMEMCWFATEKADSQHLKQSHSVTQYARHTHSRCLLKNWMTKVTRVWCVGFCLVNT